MILFFLLTLPLREFRAGLAEVIKYALIHDNDFFNYLCENREKVSARSPEVLAYIIETSVKIKIEFVEQDERDELGKRALLNFGHTFGHALESVMDFTLLHGEAVAWGLRCACQLSRRLGYITFEEVSKVEKLLKDFGLFIQLPKTATADLLLSVMNHDKKNSDNKMTLILLKQVGEAFVTNSVEPRMIVEVMQENLC